MVWLRPSSAFRWCGLLFDVRSVAVCLCVRTSKKVHHRCVGARYVGVIGPRGPAKVHIDGQCGSIIIIIIRIIISRLRIVRDYTNMNALAYRVNFLKTEGFMDEWSGE